jgi:hypothetical protein
MSVPALEIGAAALKKSVQPSTTSIRFMGDLLREPFLALGPEGLYCTKGHIE